MAAPRTRGPMMGWGSPVNERRRSNRYYLELCMSWEGLSKGNGWPAFQALASGRQHLEYRHHTITPVGITTVFEVLL